jgi:hypothetical protein
MQSPGSQPKTSDIKCLKCGAFNLLENHVCGRCGANLPVIFDDAGEVFNWREDPHYRALLEPNASRRLTPFQRALWLRAGTILFLFLLILWLLRR